jgi:hypothetical protein
LKSITLAVIRVAGFQITLEQNSFPCFFPLITFPIYALKIETTPHFDLDKMPKDDPDLKANRSCNFEIPNVNDA